MPTFPIDELDPAQSHGDLLLQICAHQRDTVVHTLRELLRTVRGSLQLRWNIDGFTGAARGPTPKNNSRNLFAFRDGTANPPTSDAALMDELVWAGAGEPGVGRRRHLSGRAHHPPARRVLGSRRPGRAAGNDRPRARDRRAAGRHERVRGTALRPRPAAASGYRSPRTSGSPIPARLKPPTNASCAAATTTRAASTPPAQLDQGLVFVAFNQSPARQFATIQTAPSRRADDRLHHARRRGLFLRPPGTRGAAGWIGKGLFDST